MNTRIKGDITDDLLEESMPIYIACELTECPVCDGSGWLISPYPSEGQPGEKCTMCEGYGYTLDLDTAILVEVNVVVTARERK